MVPEGWAQRQRQPLPAKPLQDWVQAASSAADHAAALPLTFAWAPMLAKLSSRARVSTLTCPTLPGALLKYSCKANGTS